MSLNNVVSAERIHIGFFGMRNAGKSSLVNRVTDQELSVVSDVKGTTTDTVKKAMELLPLGPVVILDTAGLDDEGALGELRIKKARAAIAICDIAVVVIDGALGKSEKDEALIAELIEKRIPYLVAHNKSDCLESKPELPNNELYVSAKTGDGVFELKEALGKFAEKIKKDRPIISDLINKGDVIILVTPIDSSAPKGRLILPQQMVLRDILDTEAIAVVCQCEELNDTLGALRNAPRLVITDSQVFLEVSKILPREIPLTSFSIIMARYKGDLDTLCHGFEVLKTLCDNDDVLICEGCTHHRQCNDIGTVKLPSWIREFSGASPKFHFTSGGEFPDDLSTYKLIVHCGACMLNENEMKNRMDKARKANVPMVNYGVAIAGMNGILERSLEPFGK